MKLLYCEMCHDLVVPSSVPKIARLCQCTRACVWWDDPKIGKLAVYSVNGINSVSIVGIHNGLLLQKFQHENTPGEFGCIQKNVIEDILSMTPPHYIFHRVDSLIIRFRPGFSDDTRFVSDKEAEEIYRNAMER